MLFRSLYRAQLNWLYYVCFLLEPSYVQLFEVYVVIFLVNCLGEWGIKVMEALKEHFVDFWS